jgi:hypothetical protein
MAQNYANAFQCSKCPGTNDASGCPAWIEYVETNVATQDVRIEKGCAGQMLPKMMLHVLAASNRPAAAIESVRNVIFDGFNGVSRVISDKMTKQIQHPNGKHLEHEV